jgi:hypothetical protein
MLFVSATEATCAKTIGKIARKAAMHFMKKTSNVQSASATGLRVKLRRVGRLRRDKRQTSNSETIREGALNDHEFEVERWALNIQC